MRSRRAVSACMCVQEHVYVGLRKRAEVQSELYCILPKISIWKSIQLIFRFLSICAGLFALYILQTSRIKVRLYRDIQQRGGAFVFHFSRNVACLIPTMYHQIIAHLQYKRNNRGINTIITKWTQWSRLIEVAAKNGFNPTYNVIFNV